METNWAAEHLQTIRTLMERSALYRRALAPISTFVGIVGILAALAGWVLKIELTGPFAVYWIGVALATVVGALLLVRKQAVKQGENFWSPPTRRVAQAMAPSLLIGLVFGSLAAITFWPEGTPGEEVDSIAMDLVALWTLLYGLALNAAGFFMPRGVRRFSWGFVVTGIILISVMSLISPEWNISLHLLMGILFGGSHLAYGIYLYFTEPRKNET